jgi:hypothetical protein
MLTVLSAARNPWRLAGLSRHQAGDGPRPGVSQVARALTMGVHKSHLQLTRPPFFFIFCLRQMIRRKWTHLIERMH